MLITIGLILLALWALGLIGGFAMGGLIHILLVVAVIVLILQFMTGRKVV